MRDTISVLMTTYRGEQAERLARSLESIYRQTIAPDEMVLVIDGDINADQETVITRYANDQRIARFELLRLPRNVGLGAALAIGQDHCTGTWIMRMDSDDISVDDRVEAQLAYIRDHPEIDLVGGWAEEFFENAPDNRRLKTAPSDPIALLRQLRWRNIICHPSVMLRASTMRRVGGFRSQFPYLEDWDLFVRLALVDAHLIVLPRVLVLVSTSRDQAARRGGWRHAASDVRFRTFCWRNGFLRFHEYATITPAFVGYRLAGGTVRNYLYRFVRTQF